MNDKDEVIDADFSADEDEDLEEGFDAIEQSKAYRLYMAIPYREKILMFIALTFIFLCLVQAYREYMIVNLHNELVDKYNLCVNGTKIVLGAGV